MVHRAMVLFVPGGFHWRQSLIFGVLALDLSPSGSSGHNSPSSWFPRCQAVVGSLNSKIAEGLSSRTPDSYTADLTKGAKRSGNPQVRRFSGRDVCAYLARLRTE